MGPSTELRPISSRSWLPGLARLELFRSKREERLRSARCKKRGVRSSQEYGVAELDTDVPARRSSLLSPA